MKNFYILWKREMFTYFLSPIACTVMMFFLFMLGYSFWLLTNLLAQGVVGVMVMSELFGSIFFWIALMIVVPVTTMRLFAEEKRAGTMETLMTAPVTDSIAVLSKYAGAVTFFVIIWLPTVAYAFLLRAFDPTLTIDLGPMFSGYLGAFLLGCFYLSIGLLASSVTRNQIVAAIFCFAMMSVTFFSGFLPYLTGSEQIKELENYLSPVVHMVDFSRGVIDTRPLVLYITGTALMLAITIKVIESRRWR